MRDNPQTEKENKYILQWQGHLTHSVTSIKHFTLKKNEPNIWRMTYRQQGTLIDTSTCGEKTKQELKGMHNRPIGTALAKVH